MHICLVAYPFYTYILTLYLLVTVIQITLGSLIVCCLHLKIVFRSCAVGVGERQRLHTAFPLMNSSNKPEAAFSHASYAFLTLYFFSFFN